MMGRGAKFIRDQEGAAAAEFAIVALLFMGIVLLIFDVGRAFWEHNRAMKACQVGVRFAIVNDMVPSGLAAWSGVIDGSLSSGAPIPVGFFNPTPGPIRCISGACDPATWGYDSLAYQDILDEAGAYFDPLLSSPAVMAVTYEHIGLGFAGNPAGPDVWPLVTVEISGIPFNFVTPIVSTLLNGMEFGKCRASLTGEDFTTCGDIDARSGGRCP